MDTINRGFFSSSSAPRGVERRSSTDRRVKLDQRTNIRFDDSGGDRRSGAGRRSNDEAFEVLE